MQVYCTAAATLPVKDRRNGYRTKMTNYGIITKSVPKTTFDGIGQLELIKLFTYLNFTESTYFSPTLAHTSACSKMAQRNNHSLQVAK